MIEVTAQMWQYASENQFDAVCVTTNGFVKKNGCNVMGKGCAKEINEILPKFDRVLGGKLKDICTRSRKVIKVYDSKTHTWEGMVPEYYPIPEDRKLPFDVLSFQVKTSWIKNPKPEQIVAHMRDKITDFCPGWAAIASLGHIEQSCQELMYLADDLGYKKILLPRPGCGAGELTYEEVKPILEKYLDDRVYVITK